MYWFNMFYYDNSPNRYVKPLTDTNGNRLVVYAATPDQATAVAEKLIAEDPYEYSQHYFYIGVMSSCVRDEDVAAWHADHR